MVQDAFEISIDSAPSDYHPNIIENNIRTMFWSDLYSSRLTPHTYIGASAEGAEMITFLAPASKWALALG